MLINKNYSILVWLQEQSVDLFPVVAGIVNARMSIVAKKIKLILKNA